jgi:hypothetical protein
MRRAVAQGFPETVEKRSMGYWHVAEALVSRHRR